ncbi:protein SGT1 homolog [Notamacropus eugenii]|uniref:protein SGT1 homolog n=1 Tax=Notamacropus eugenii TaxID=9315 RepID=UPI003B6832BE
MDAKKSLGLNPNNSTALLRKGIGENHDENYAEALESFTEGHKLDDTVNAFNIWIKRCQETKNKVVLEPARQTQQSKIKYDWYQTESQVIITLMIKNVQKNDINVVFSENELSEVVTLPSGEDYSFKVSLIHSMIPEQSTFKTLSTKFEIKMKKSETVRWEKLEGPKQFTPDSKHMYPPSSHYTRN